MASFKFYNREELEAMDEQAEQEREQQAQRATRGGSKRKVYDPVYDLSQPLPYDSVEARPRAKPKNGRTSKRVGVAYSRTQKVWRAELAHKGKKWNKSCLTEAEAIAWRERFELAAFGRYGNATPATRVKHGDKYIHVRAVCEDGVVRNAKQIGDPLDEFTVPGVVKLASHHSVSGRLFVDPKAKVWFFVGNYWTPNYGYMQDSIDYETGIQSSRIWEHDEE